MVAAPLAFKRVLAGILRDSVLREGFLRDSARLVGRRGGRPAGREQAHTRWLRERLQVMIRRDPCPTAAQIFVELRHHPDVEDNERDHFTLRFEVLDQYGYAWRPGSEEPKITIKVVSRVLTRLRQGS